MWAGPAAEGAWPGKGRGYLQHQSDVSADLGPVARQGIAEPGRGGAKVGVASGEGVGVSCVGVAW